MIIDIWPDGDFVYHFIYFLLNLIVFALNRQKSKLGLVTNSKSSWKEF